MCNTQVLWVDDEIDLLTSHVIFLEQKKYCVTTCTNGIDAIDLIKRKNYDIVLLDENMPGINGLETLASIKQLKPNLPAVMITKSEEEFIMEEAIGSKIADYLIKPVNPNQLLLSLKKNLEHARLISDKTTANYQQEFQKISADLMTANSFSQWSDLYQKLVHWELELEQVNDLAMMQILNSQKSEANSLFYKYIRKNYQTSLTSDQKPTFSNTVFKEHVVPNLGKKEGLLWVVIDNLRYDQYRVIEPFINNYYKKEQEYSYYSILPTATQYARNAMFSGLMPSEMEKEHPNLWKNDHEDGGKNKFENEFLKAQIKRLNLTIKHEYYKIVSLKNGKELANSYNKTKNNDLTVLVYNFVDMLSHLKTEMEVIKELAGDDKAYRSLTVSWFKNSPLFEIIKKAQQLGQKLILTTDHGTINCRRPTKIIGDKNISTNLRYKTGKSLTYSKKDVFVVKNPKDIFLPCVGFNSPFIFAKETFFFAYPNNYNYFVNFFKNTYQHGGVSLEEMIIPLAVYNAR